MWYLFLFLTFGILVFNVFSACGSYFSKSMNKVKVNNQVVLMRKFVKQAKVHTINKLVKDINMLQKKKGTDQQLAKNKRKEERFIEEIKIIQKLPVDEVSRKVLLQLKDWNSLIPNKTISMKERAFARVACFAPLQAEVKKFISENSELKNLLPDLFEEWSVKKSNPLYQEAKKLKASEIKFQRKQKLVKLKQKFKDFEMKKKFNVKTELKNSFVSQDKNQTLHENKNSFTKITDAHAKNSDNEDISGEDENISEEDDDISGEDDDISGEDDESEADKDNFKDSFLEDVIKSEGSDNVYNTSSKGNVQKFRKKKEIAVLSLTELQNKAILESRQSDSDSESDEQISDITNLKKDAFFTAADESFDEESDNNAALEKQNFTKSSNTETEQKKFRKFSTNKPWPKQTFREGRKNTTNNFSHRKTFQKQFNNKQQREDSTAVKHRSSFKDKNFQHHSPKFSHDKKWSSKPSSVPKFNSARKGSAPFKGSPNLNKKETSLHPSWEAKKKLKEKTSKILPFQGKKITFE